jgi:hypothetical protein
MRRTLIIIPALFLLTALAGCGDDDTPPPGSDGPVTTDTGTTQDTGVSGDGPVATQDTGTTQQDTGTTQEQGTTPQDAGTAKWDGTTKKLSCGEIGLCANACGLTCPSGAAKLACLINCSNGCKAKACASALPVYTPLYNCINSKCILDCFNGPGTKCTTCVTTKCKSETDTCNAHKC